MGWNGSTRKPIKVVQPRKKAQRNPFVLVGCLVFAIILIALIAFLIYPEPETEEAVTVKHQKKRSLAVTPAPPTVHYKGPSNILSEVKIDIPEDQTTNRVAKHSGRFIDISKAKVMPRRDKPRRFEHQAEEAIASLLEITPGATIVGSIDYHKHGRFEKSFKESLISPTLTLQTDDDYTKELKSAVNEVKAELKQRMDSGEDIADLMTKSRDELQQLGLYRMQLQRELNEIRKDAKTTAEEYEDFVKAANTMLEEKGAKPLSIPRVVYKQLILRQERTMNQ